jgi:predicted ATP-grasp superfamily ATP-dependent carboligase
LRESIPLDPERLRQVEALLDALDYEGPVMAEFRTDAKECWLIELNARLWGSLQLAVDAGVDFPRLLVALYRSETVAPVEPRIGVRSRWLLGDLDHLAIALRRRSARQTLGRTPLGVIAQFLRSFFDGTKLDVWRRSDPGPFRSELRDRLRRS